MALLAEAAADPSSLGVNLLFLAVPDEEVGSAGMKAAVKSDTSQGKTFWRVIIGPVATVAERDALAAKVKALGYPDAYPVSK